jgi:probable addiction module antidote protein
MPIETTRFDILDHLRTPEEQVAYLEAVLEENDPAYLAVAIGNVARARGVTRFAEEAGLSREVIYKAFAEGGNPTLDTLSKALGALGLRLTVAPLAREDAA